MKVSVLLCACVAVVALWPLAEGARAGAPGAPAQKQMPNFYRLTQDDPAAEKACTDKGGVVSTDQDGNKVCTLRRACPAPGGPTQTTKLDAGDPAAAQKCTDACGAVSTDATGSKVCTKPN